ncbi:transporter substrate-binding domain-containing protein [Ferviditalea candida]|uniref:Transporter substrate-binding domain-containing protein n=1 Tax=Ferviditalea candida TaxID=3108399 RepID=A0ABU5ZIB5_9BACL|nr:transporter substrate-binding domain-containing protein [Paenibacillaceae bacterium T2]
MKARRNIWILISLIGMLALTACTGNKTMIVGVESNFKPFTYVEEGSYKGFEIDLWNAIAREAGFKKYKFEAMDFGELIEAVKTGKADVGLAGMTINQARKNELEFSMPYYDTGLVLLTSASNKQIHSTHDLKDKTVGTKLATTGYQFSSELQGLKSVKGYPEISQAFEDLMNNKVDAVIFDEQPSRNFVRTAGKGKVKILGGTLTKENYGMFTKKRGKNIGRIDQAIEAVSQNGTYEKIYRKWFGKKPDKLPGS